MDALRRILCYTNNRNAALCGSVFQYTGIAVSKQTETGKPCLTFFLSVSNYMLYSFLIKLYNKSGTPPS